MSLNLSTDFPGGNGHLLGVEHSADGEVIRFAAQSKRGEPQPLWFHFRIQGAQGPRIRCILANAGQCLGDVNGWAANAPVYRTGNGDWQRVGSVHLQENEHLVQEAVFDIFAGSNSVEIAFCYPYQATDLEDTLKSLPVWKSCVIGQSPGDHQLIRLYNDLGDEQRSKPGIYLMARHHSGETPGSLVLDGMLRYLASEQGKKACENICWWINPFSDIDGVLDGSYGKDQAPVDINRAWNTPFPTRAEVKAIMADLSRWMRRCRPLAVIDLHAPSHEESGFYFHLPKAPTPLLEMSKQLADRLHHAVPESLRGNLIHTYDRLDHTSAQSGVNSIDFVIRELACMGATFEIAYQGPRTGEYYSIEDYHTIGRALVDVLYEFTAS